MKKPTDQKKASKSKKNRKYGRNFPNRDRSKSSKYVSRMKSRGTYRERKGISNRKK